ncbi:extracellular solute-binding protein [Chloroflexi bacterium TSY]|nr:extracellular solute-binding protein [Chloroflexi bacterium TSY]MBV7333244.1 extracellular solute-binding protein [Chloroflexi bacterium TSY]
MKLPTPKWFVIFAITALILTACPAAPGDVPASSSGGDATDETVSLELWTFVNTHARWFQEQAERYKEEVNPNFELEVVEIAYGDMHDRLLISLQSGGAGAPDLSDIEQGRFGGFLRGGGDPGLVPLNDLLAEGGYNDQLVSARQALYSYEGVTYGVEHALTPVVLYYRADVWEGAGFDPQTFATWDDFAEAAAALVADNPDVVPLPVHGSLHELLLRQRGADYFNADGEVTIDSAISIETMDWIMAQVDAGIAAQMPSGDAAWAAFKDGSLISMVGADWYAGFFKDNAPELEGLWKAAPLPAWEEGGIRTSVWGGTGLTVVKTSPNVEAALDFLEFAMLSVEGNVRRFEMTNLFPPFIPAMDNERLHAEDAYFSGQDLGAVFADVGPEAPAQFQSPFRSQLNDLRGTAFQDLIDGNRTPEEVFTEIAEAVRDEMALESE